MKILYRASLYHMMTILIALLLFFPLLNIFDCAHGTQTDRATTGTTNPGAYEASPSAPRQSGSGSQDPQSDPYTGVWLGPDGNALPFTNDNEICDFLRTAKVVRVSDLSTGTTKPKKLLLEKDGVQLHAIFHYEHYVSRREKLKGGQTVLYFRDSYINQVAAYKMSRLLGITNVAPTVMREVNGKKGSVQMWIENAMNERDRMEKKLYPPNRSIIELYAHDMRVFDNLINNIDRNFTNILYDSNWRLWFIDHTRAFGRNSKLPNKERLRRCSGSLWKKLQSLDDRLVEETLKPYMGRVEISKLLSRRDKIIKLFKEKIEKKGESNVLFDYGKL